MNDKYTITVQARITPEMRRVYQAEADFQHMTISDIIRHAMASYSWKHELPRLYPPTLSDQVDEKIAEANDTLAEIDEAERDRQDQITDLRNGGLQ